MCENTRATPVAFPFAPRGTWHVVVTPWVASHRVGAACRTPGLQGWASCSSPGRQTHLRA